MSIFVDHKALKHLLKKLKDVLISAPADGEVLTYETATKKWKNKPSVAALYYLSVDGTTDDSTHATAPDTIDQMEFTIPAGKGGTYLCMLSMNILMSKEGGDPLVDRYAQIGIRNMTTLAWIARGMVMRDAVQTNLALSVSMMRVASLAAGNIVRCFWWISNADTGLYNQPSSLPAFYWRSLMLIKLA